MSLVELSTGSRTKRTSRCRQRALRESSWVFPTPTTFGLSVDIVDSVAMGDLWRTAVVPVAPRPQRAASFLRRHGVSPPGVPETDAYPVEPVTDAAKLLARVGALLERAIDIDGH